MDGGHEMGTGNEQNLIFACKHNKIGIQNVTTIIFEDRQLIGFEKDRSTAIVSMRASGLHTLLSKADI